MLPTKSVRFNEDANDTNIKFQFTTFTKRSGTIDSLVIIARDNLY